MLLQFSIQLQRQVPGLCTALTTAVWHVKCTWTAFIHVLKLSAQAQTQMVCAGRLTDW